MRANIPIYNGEREVGSVTWQKDGMTYLLSAEAQLSGMPKELLYLYLQKGDHRFRLGIPAPCGTNWCMKKRISVSTLRDADVLPEMCDRAFLSSDSALPTRITQEVLIVQEKEENMPGVSAVQTTAEEEITIPVMEVRKEAEAVPLQTPTPEIPVPNELIQETPLRPITELDWSPAGDISAILSDNVLLPLLRGKSDLIAKRDSDTIKLAIPYDALDEICFTPAFCLMDVIAIEGKTYFSLTIDNSGWPIAPPSEEPLPSL